MQVAKELRLLCDLNPFDNLMIGAMINGYGMEGYGWYWAIMGLINRQEERRICVSNGVGYKALALQTNSTPEKIAQFVHACVNDYVDEGGRGLLQTDGNYVWSDKLLLYQENEIKKTARAKSAAGARWHKDNPGKHREPDADALHTQYDRNTTVMRPYNKPDANVIRPHSKRKADAMQVQCEPDADAMQVQCDRNATVIRPNNERIQNVVQEPRKTRFSIVSDCQGNGAESLDVRAILETRCERIANKIRLNGVCEDVSGGVAKSEPEPNGEAPAKANSNVSDIILSSIDYRSLDLKDQVQKENDQNDLTDHFDQEIFKKDFKDLKDLKTMFTSTSTEADPEKLPPKPVSKKRSKKAVDFADDSVEMQLARKLKGYILANNPKARVPADLKGWSGHFDKMLRLDNRTLDEIESVMEFSQTSSFWMANILSAEKLRTKFDQLTLQMRHHAAKSKRDPAQGGILASLAQWRSLKEAGKLDLLSI